MQEHIVKIVETDETLSHNGKLFTFRPIYDYCENTGEYLEDINMLKTNYMRMMAASEDVDKGS